MRGVSDIWLYLVLKMSILGGEGRESIPGFLVYRDPSDLIK